jgi:hypothetical protein
LSFLIAILLVSAQPNAAPVNFGFETGDLSGWEVSLPRDYAAVADTDRPYSGQFSAFLAYLSRRSPDQSAEASLRTSLAARPWRGRHVRISAMLRLEAAGSARLEAIASGATASVVATSRQWHRAHLVLAVPQAAESIVIRISVSPGNDVQVDDVRIEPL